jgi:phosphoketolase
VFEGANSLGKLDHIILKHSKVNVIVFQKSNVTFYISINSKEKSLDKIISLIKKTI